MKGYLKSADGGLFQLAPKVTTVGREGCDLTIQTPGVDYQHAVIEFSDQEECFVLQDLNTSQGTYVNECRVQNAAVRLAPGDVVKFGASSLTYELEVENPAQVAYPPVHQRSAWTQPLTVISDHAHLAGTVYTTESLPQLQSVMKTTTAMWSPSNGSQGSPPGSLPRPPHTTLRSRPLSAGSVIVRPRAERGGTGAGWVVSGSPARTIVSNATPETLQNMQEKEQRILRLQEEVRRLSLYESECSRKEEVIQTLREEIADLQGRLRQIETSRSVITGGVGPEGDLLQKLTGLETEVQQKRAEVAALRDQLTRVKTEPNRSSPVSREDFNQRVLELNSLRSELERTKKDKNITSGLVNQMQRDMANKDTTVSRLTREVENLKKEVKDKDVQLLAMQTKVAGPPTPDPTGGKHPPGRTYRLENGSYLTDSTHTVYYIKESKPHVDLRQFKRVDDNRKVEAELEGKERELAGLKLRFRSTENRVQEQSDLIASLKSEIEKIKKEAQDSRENHKKVSGDLDSARSKCLDLERAERVVRVDLQQTKVKLDRLKDRVLQVTFSTPGVKAPNEALDDDDLIQALKKVIGERTELFRQVHDLKDSLQQANAIRRDVTDGAKKLKSQLADSTTRLRQKGFSCGNVRQEVDLLTSISLDENVTWIKERSVELLKSVLAWQADIETALGECGVNVMISDQGPSEHIRELHRRARDLQEAMGRLEEMQEKVKAGHKSELEAVQQTVRAETNTKVKDEVERARLEGDERLNRAIDEIRMLEEEKRENALQTERVKVTELEVSLAQLRASLVEKEEEHSQHKETAREALEQLEVGRKVEIELRTQMSQLEVQLEDKERRMSSSTEAAEVKYREEISSYQEQIKQHSVTICAMEERLNKILKRNKDYQAEITQLKATVQDLKIVKPKPPSAPKPKVIIQKPVQDVVAMEQLITQLRRENVDFKKQIADQQTVISGLRRDLTGASAKLSDMTGELSERQKEEMETERAALRLRQSELVESRSNMAQLTAIVDKQAADLKQHKEEISKQKVALSKLKNILTEREGHVRELEDKLASDEEEQKKRLSNMQEEGRITSELSSLGAQCRGERHDQVITRQREALTELRMRIKALEQVRPAVPSHDQALQQVMILKKELAELRASQAVTENRTIAETILEKQVQRARGLQAGNPADNAGLEVERSAHRETMESLEYSETSYLTLLRGVASSLEMDEVAGLRSMAHIPRDERRRLFEEREQACEVVTGRVKVLRERVIRKDELLQGYERDLAKLRQAEMLADQRHAQLEGLSSDVRGRTEEMQYLRETLQRTRERLEQEKRLNAAIKQKKTFHLENEQSHMSPPTNRKPHCETEDIFAKKDSKKKDRTEKIKRKNYEIRMLKGELSNKDQQLTMTRKSLVGLHNTAAHGTRIVHSAPQIHSPSSSSSLSTHTPTPHSILRQSRAQNPMFKSSPNLAAFDESEAGEEAGDGAFSAVSSAVMTESVDDLAESSLNRFSP